VPDHANEVGIVADVLGRAAAGNDERGVVLGIDILEGQVRRPRLTRLDHERIEPGHELVHLQLEQLRARCGDDGLVSLLSQALMRAGSTGHG